MSLFAQWKHDLENQTDESFDLFWDKYSTGETAIYSHILGEAKADIHGKIIDLAEKYKVDPVIFMGFLDGINSSLIEELKLENLKEEDEISFSIDFEKLYYNMLAAKADYLFGLEQWQGILSDQKRQEIEKNYKKSKTVIKEKTPGRNDPCPCGSGKKYKKCCGA